MSSNGFEQNSGNVEIMMKKLKRLVFAGTVFLIFLSGVFVYRVFHPKGKEYLSLVNRAMRTVALFDYSSMDVYAYDYGNVVNQASGGGLTEEELRQTYQDRQREEEQMLKNNFGVNYRIHTVVKKVKKVTKSDIEQTIAEHEDIHLSYLTKKIDITAYFDVSSIDEMKMLTVKTVVIGRGRRKATYGMADIYIVRLKGEEEWKVMIIDRENAHDLW